MPKPAVVNLDLGDVERELKPVLVAAANLAEHVITVLDAVTPDEPDVVEPPAAELTAEQIASLRSYANAWRDASGEVMGRVADADGTMRAKHEAGDGLLAFWAEVDRLVGPQAMASVTRRTIAPAEGAEYHLLVIGRPDGNDLRIPGRTAADVIDELKLTLAAEQQAAEELDAEDAELDAEDADLDAEDLGGDR